MFHYKNGMEWCEHQLHAGIVFSVSFPPMCPCYIAIMGTSHDGFAPLVPVIIRPGYIRKAHLSGDIHTIL